MARTAAQIAALKKAQAASALARKRKSVTSSAVKGKHKSALAEIKRFNKHGPIKGITEPFLKDSPSQLSRPASGIHGKPKKKRTKSNFAKKSEHEQWKSTWGMGAG